MLIAEIVVLYCYVSISFLIGSLLLCYYHKCNLCDKLEHVKQR